MVRRVRPFRGLRRDQEVRRETKRWVDAVIAKGTAHGSNDGMESEPQTQPVLALVRDLLFSSRIVGAGKQAGKPLKIVRDPARLESESGSALLVDLNLEGAIEAAAAWQTRTGRPATGFVFHVDGPTIARARAAGLDRVMTRGQFADSLPTLLKSL